MNTLKAEKRSMDIKAKKLRREGYVTGNVFGREMKESIPIKMTKGDVDRLLKTSNKGSRLRLEIDGEPYNVLIKELSFNPVKGQMEEIDFQALVSNEKIHSVAEVEVINAHKPTDGVVEQLIYEIPYKALPAALVEKIEVDAGDLHLGDSIRVGDLDIAKDKDVDLSIDLDATVVTVKAVHNDIPEDDATADEAGAEA